MDNEDIVVVHDDIVIIGFLNSNGELEYSQYNHYDGGMITIDKSKKYNKEELSELLLSNINKAK